MSKMVDGAKKCKGADVKPGDNNPAVDCPCDQFLQCSTRMPYGAKVWSNKRKRKKAMSVISYKSVGRAKVMKYTRRGLYRDLRAETDKNNIKPLVLSEIDENCINAHMAGLKISNAKKFSNFQRMMIGRANLVQNGRIMKSDGYGEIEGEHKRVNPSLGRDEHNDDEWNVDHIYTRAKGGCNRFCNAQILSREINLKKLDEAAGCICAETEKNDSGMEKDFRTGGDTDKSLFQCYPLTCKVEKPPNIIPEFPPGMIEEYNGRCEICVLDDPRHWSKKLQKSAKNRLLDEINKISK